MKVDSEIASLEPCADAVRILDSWNRLRRSPDVLHHVLVRASTNQNVDVRQEDTKSERDDGVEHRPPLPADDDSADAHERAKRGHRVGTVFPGVRDNALVVQPRSPSEVVVIQILLAYCGDKSSSHRNPADFVSQAVVDDLVDPDDPRSDETRTDSHQHQAKSCSHKRLDALVTILMVCVRRFGGDTQADKEKDISYKVGRRMYSICQNGLAVAEVACQNLQKRQAQICPCHPPRYPRPCLGTLSITQPCHWHMSSRCLLYTSDAADDLLCVDLGGRRIIKKKNKKNTKHQRTN